MELARLISVARGELPADLLLANARVINVFTGEIESGNVAICGDRIAGIGDYQQAKQELDLRDKFLAPGLINGHTHLESSMLDMAQYARAVVPRGTSAIVTDLHEIANVCGLEGIRYILNGARRLPLKLADAIFVKNKDDQQYRGDRDGRKINKKLRPHHLGVRQPFKVAEIRMPGGHCRPLRLITFSLQ